MNRKAFFDKVRHQPFPGSLAAQAVQGMDAILNEWERRGLTDLRWLAYMLATTFHETARTMQPIAEYGRGRGKKYGTPDPVTGQTYYGRGFVQLTWIDNYRKMGELLGADLVNHPDKAMELHIAAAIMFEGMIRGSFTGKKLADYFDGSHTDWTNARKIINGLDKAETIAAYARQFHGALIVAQEAPSDVVSPRPDIPKPINLPAPIEPKPSNVGGGVVATTATIGGAVIANETAKKGASATEITIVIILALIIAVAAFFVIRNWKKSS